MEPAKLVLVFENFSLRGCVIVWCYGNFFNIESSLSILCCVKKCRVRYNIFSNGQKLLRYIKNSNQFDSLIMAGGEFKN